MLTIRTLKTEDLAECPVTDENHPRFHFSLESDRNGTRLQRAVFTLEDWTKETEEQSAIYDGAPLKPRTQYSISVTAEDNNGEKASASMWFETGKLEEPWSGKWISHPHYIFREKRVSPKPMCFRKQFAAGKAPVSARLYCTALGLYVCTLNGVRVGEDYLAPGFTSYHHQIQYQTYDVTALLQAENELSTVVTGGWAVGSYTYFRRNRIYAPRQAFLAELHIRYADGSEDCIATNNTWEAAFDGRLRSADLYDGEEYDANGVTENWENASEEALSFTPRLLAAYGAPVHVYEQRTAAFMGKSPSGEYLYDFGQNFAGVVSFRVRAQKGQKVRLRHAEILMDGELFTEPLRTAKQEILYTCRGGEESYAPRFTYMGFRYVGVSGVAPECIELTALLLSSRMEVTGRFTCSDERINRLQKNIYYGARSNFMDIPTDCPQRDERLGWTGDMALFASTACFNFDMSRFSAKWLCDVRAEQGLGGGLPMIVPTVKIYNQWEMCVAHAVDHWGDVCILLPWAEYLARGDIRVLRDNYPAMKRYLRACQWWAGLFSHGEKRYIWKLFHHYGDWCAPDTGFNGWMARGQWTATACLSHSAVLLCRIASLLGENQDAAAYEKTAKAAVSAYRHVFLKDDLRLRQEFQTAYVLPLYYRMLDEKDRKVMAGYLAELVRKQGISTGFPGTPYLLFALADNGQEELAFETLMSEKCPSWLYEVKAGGTSFWERWDALREDGTCNQGDGGGMVSFNHFAPGAVGDFLYRRIAGIEPLEGGYRRFQVAPNPLGGIHSGCAEQETPYGRISVSWTTGDGRMSISLAVPVGTTCELKYPDGQVEQLASGNYSFNDIAML
ncbi:MAG: family 78 glycoside hydrolase catalytic domain [Clostridia bacterium]|nr:family 78 glycoside hydrolase catalytic domain [Clostridia bacterium]